MSIEIGAVKIKDGFFIGDVYAAKDIEFVILNKITRIVNCAATEIPNIFSAEGVLYMPFDWSEDNEQEYLADKEQIDRAIEFMNNSAELGESVLIHSVRCQNRAVFMCACYLVKHFRWSASTATNFIYTRKEMPKMKPEVERLVMQYEKMEVKQEEVRNIIWQADEIRRSLGMMTPEEVVLANTFLNMSVVAENKQPTKRINGQKLQWNDRVNSHRSSVGFKNRLCTAHIPSYEQMPFNKPILRDVTFFKSILKGSEAKILKQNLVQIQNGAHILNIPHQRASSANPNNLSRTQKMKEDSSKKLKLNKISSVDKENKELQSQFYQLGSYVKRNTLQLNSSGKVLRKQNSSGSNFHRSSSKDKKLQALISYNKHKMTTFYSKFGVYGPYRSDKGVKNYNKSMKKIASTKMIRPHSGNNNAITGPPTSNQVRSFMQGLIKMQQEDFPK